MRTPVDIVCPNADCGHKYQVNPSEIGQSTVCPRCGRQFTVGRGEAHRALPAEALESTIPFQPRAVPRRDRAMLNRLGRFEIRSRLGAGAFGAVYRAYDPVLDREVALKIPRASALEHAEAKARFLREPKAAAQLRHPHIVPVFDAGSDGERFYIASAFIEGRTLKAALAEGRPEFRRTAQIVRQVADALDYAHRMGVVHRDIKPGNIMLDAAGQPMLMDFGLARLESSTEEKLTQDGTVMGTPAYMAPEQAGGALDEVGPPSDQYSLGVVLYEMLCGERPFRGSHAELIYQAIHKTPDPPRSRNATLPRDLETICLKAVSKRPEDRYASCGEMAEDLRRWLDDEPIRARRMGLVERAGKWARRQPVLAGLTLAVTLLAVAGTISAVGLFHSRESMARALENTRQQTQIAQTQSARAEEQSQRAQERQRLAQDRERAAQEQERIAESALAKLQAEVEAHQRAEAQRKAELDKQATLAHDLKQRESKIAEASTTLDATTKRVETIDKERGAYLGADKSELYYRRADKWKLYVDLLTSADRACARKDYAAARKFLQDCPQEHRAWEWDFLRQLSEGRLSPRETIVRPSQLKINRGPIRFSLADSGWLWAKGPTSELLMYLLPACESRTQVPSSFVDAAPYLLHPGCCQLSPDGKTLMMASRENVGTGPLNDWIICDLKSNQWLRFKGRPASDQAFSANGKYAMIFREDRLEIVHLGGSKLLTVDTGIPRRRFARVGFDESGRYFFGASYRASSRIKKPHTHTLTAYRLPQPGGQSEPSGLWTLVPPRRSSFGGCCEFARVCLDDEDSRKGQLPQTVGCLVFSDKSTPSKPVEYVLDLSTKGAAWALPPNNMVIGISPDRKRILTSGPPQSTRSLVLWSIDAKAAIPALSSLPWGNWKGDYDYFVNGAWSIVAAMPRNCQGSVDIPPDTGVLYCQSGPPPTAATPSARAVPAEAQSAPAPGQGVVQKKSQNAEAYAALLAALGAAAETKTEVKARVSDPSWLRYADRLVAADRALAKGNRQAALNALEQCPEEHRAWEWEFLSQLAEGQVSARESRIRPSQMGIDRGPLRVSVGPSAWLWGQPRGSAPAVFALPACRKHGQIPFKPAEHAPLSSFSHQYSPDGKTVILADLPPSAESAGKGAPKPGGKWTILDVSSSRSLRTDWISTQPFSPNGAYAISNSFDGSFRVRMIDLRDREWSATVLLRASPLGGSSPFVRFDSSSGYVFTVNSWNSWKDSKWRVDLWDVRQLTARAKADASWLLPKGIPFEPADHWGKTVLHLDQGAREDGAKAPSGGRLLLAGKCVYDLDTKTLLWEVPQSTMALGLSPDGLRVLARDSTGAIAIWNVETKAPVPALSSMPWCRWGLEYTCFFNEDWMTAVAVPTNWMGSVEIPSDAALLHWHSAPSSAKATKE